MSDTGHHAAGPAGDSTTAAWAPPHARHADVEISVEPANIAPSTTEDESTVADHSQPKSDTDPGNGDELSGSVAVSATHTSDAPSNEVTDEIVEETPDDERTTVLPRDFSQAYAQHSDEISANNTNHTAQPTEAEQPTAFYPVLNTAEFSDETDQATTIVPAQSHSQADDDQATRIVARPSNSEPDNEQATTIVPPAGLVHLQDAEQATTLIPPAQNDPAPAPTESEQATTLVPPPAEQDSEFEQATTIVPRPMDKQASLETDQATTLVPPAPKEQDLQEAEAEQATTLVPRTAEEPPAFEQAITLVPAASSDEHLQANDQATTLVPQSGFDQATTVIPAPASQPDQPYGNGADYSAAARAAEEMAAAQWESQQQTQPIPQNFDDNSFSPYVPAMPGNPVTAPLQHAYPQAEQPAFDQRPQEQQHGQQQYEQPYEQQPFQQYEHAQAAYDQQYAQQAYEQQVQPDGQPQIAGQQASGGHQVPAEYSGHNAWPVSIPTSTPPQYGAAQEQYGGSQEQYGAAQEQYGAQNVYQPDHAQTGQAQPSYVPTAQQAAYADSAFAPPQYVPGQSPAVPQAQLAPPGSVEIGVPTTVGDVSPSAEEFAKRREHKPSEPDPTMGMPALVRKLSFGLIAPAMSKKEVEHRDAVATVRRNFGGLRQVTVVNPKGGAGKTVAVLMTAMTFGQNRGGYVLAWDNNETQGTLGMRAQPDFHSHTVRDVLQALEQFQGMGGKVGDLTRFVRSQGEAMFDVLASDESATAGEMLTAEAFTAIREIVDRFYKLMIVDTGNNVRAENWQAAIDATDQLIVTMSARGDSAETAARMLDHLEQTGRADLARNAVTVVSMPATRKGLDLPAIERHFSARTRAVLVAPYEGLLDSGEPIRYEALSKNSREAWLKITAAVAAGL